MENCSSKHSPWFLSPWTENYDHGDGDETSSLTETLDDPTECTAFEKVDKAEKIRYFAKK